MNLDPTWKKQIAPDGRVMYTAQMESLLLFAGQLTRDRSIRWVVMSGHNTLRRKGGADSIESAKSIAAITASGLLTSDVMSVQVV